MNILRKSIVDDTVTTICGGQIANEYFREVETSIFLSRDISIRLDFRTTFMCTYLYAISV